MIYLSSRYRWSIRRFEQCCYLDVRVTQKCAAQKFWPNLTGPIVLLLQPSVSPLSPPAEAAMYGSDLYTYIPHEIQVVCIFLERHSTSFWKPFCIFCLSHASSSFFCNNKLVQPTAKFFQKQFFPRCEQKEAPTCPPAWCCLPTKQSLLYG